MPTNPPDKVQREIEELLDKLDNFIPEERFAEKIRSRRRQQRTRTGPSVWDKAAARFSQISLGHVMIAGVVLMIVGYFFRDPLGDADRWVMLAGLGLTLLAFALSVMSGGGHRTTIGARRVQKRWRGQVIEYHAEPSRMERIREWFRRRGRR